MWVGIKCGPHQFYGTCLALNFHPNMQTKKPKLIFHSENYSWPLQIILKISVGNWELVWITLTRQNSVVYQ